MFQALISSIIKSILSIFMAKYDQEEKEKLRSEANTSKEAMRSVGESLSVEDEIRSNQEEVTDGKDNKNYNESVDAWNSGK